MPRLFPGSSNNYLSPGNPASLNIGGQIVTMACWIRPAAFSGSATLLAKWVGGNNEYILVVDVSNKLLAAFAGSSFATSSASLVLDRWQHVVGTLSGSAALAYINGVQDGSAGAATMTTSASTVTVGGSGTEGFNGMIAHAAIWAATLTPVEIRLLASGVRPDQIRPESLRAYWPLDDFILPGLSLDKSIYKNTLAMTGTVGYKAQPSPPVPDLPVESIKLNFKRPAVAFAYNQVLVSHG